MAESEDPRAVRRIVTGVNASGRSMIVSDGPIPNRFTADFAPLYVQTPWVSGESAVPGIEPAPPGVDFPTYSVGGTVFRLSDFPPDSTYDQAKLHAMLDDHGIRDKEEPRHFWFHRSPTLDYALCLEGEIYAMLDEGETLMRAGDILVQRATNHSWSNRSSKPCRMAFVLVCLDEKQLAEMAQF